MTSAAPASEPAPQGDAALVVTASRYARKLFETSSSVNLVDRDRLARDIPRTPAEALRNQPGIWVQQTSHIGGAPIIRGLMGNQVLYLVDGVRINTVDAPAGPNSLLQSVDIETLDRIEVVRGPGSVLYGTDALGGVINMITQPPAEYTEEGWKAGGLVKTTFSGVDAGRRVRVQGYGTGTDLRLRLGVTAEDVEDLRGGGNIGTQHPSSWAGLSYDARLDWRPTSNQELSASFWNVEQDDILRFDTALRATASSSDRTRRLYRLGWEARDLTPFWSKVSALAALHDQTSVSRSLTVPGNSVEDEFLTPSAELQFQSVAGDWLKLTYGGHFHRDDGESKGQEDGVHTSSFPDVTWDNFAGFLLAEATPMERLTVLGGLRFDRFNFKSDASGFTAPDGISSDDLNLDLSNQAVTGSLGILGRLTEWLNLVAQFGTAFRAPGSSDLVSSGPFTYGYSVPSTDVEPEKSKTAEAGLRVEHRYVGASLNWFYTWLTDIISNQPSTLNGKNFVDLDGDGQPSDGEDVYAPANAGEAHITGVEGSVELRLPPHWTLMMQASYLTGRNDTEDGPVDRAYPLNGGGALRWQDKARGPAHWLELNTRWATEFSHRDVPEDRLSSDPAYRRDPRDKATGLLGGDGDIPAYWIFGLRAGTPICENIDLRLSVDNLFNAEYRDKDSRIDGPGLNAVGSLTGRF